VVVGPADPDKADAIDPALVEQARASDGVVFTGQRTDMVACYSAMDLFVTASWREGFPRSAMEAAAMGLATVATDIRGNRQVVVDGETGVLVPVRSPAALATGIECLVSDPDRRRAAGAAARSRAVTHFDQAHVIDVTLAAYALLPRPPVPSV
jgi:glycosyltransferase involved in cell wall biosynthesis